VNGVPIFDPDTPPTFQFSGRHSDREQSAYAQDLIRMGNFTLSAGLRFDHYSLLVDQSAFSPRLGASWYSKRLGLVLHASYDRTFGTPPFENILVSASPLTRALNDHSVYLPLQPSRGNYYEAGFAQSIFGKMRLDGSYFRRDIRNFQDDDLLLNTGVSFPIAFHSASIRGVEAKLEMPRWGPFTSFLSYANTIGVARFPIAGGLFLGDGSAALLNSTDRFPVTQDQRNTARGKVRYQIHPRVWSAFSATYNSGLPVDNIGDGQTTDFLIAQYGSAVVNSVNFDRSRVHPYFSLDASVGAELWRSEKRSVSIQGDVLNLTNRLNVIDFAGLLSGTAIGPPRSFGLRLRTEF
jgi:outer membrane receptor for Fe3+-dicitrate